MSNHDNSRSAKFPLTLHKTGQYCKKIRGKTYYFGKDKQEALRLYYQRATELHAAERPGQSKDMTLLMLCNLYLDYQETQVASDSLTPQQYYHQRLYLKMFAKWIGPIQMVSRIRTADIQQYRAGFIRDHKAPNTINNYLSPIKAMFNWALDNEILDQAPNLKAVKKVTAKKVKRQVFTPDQVRQLLAAAKPHMRAMILLGLNCGFGVMDCAQLKWENIDLQTGTVDYPRGKTGVHRRFTLWPETLAAVKAMPVRGEYVFYTRTGRLWSRPTDGDKHSYDRPLSKEFKKLMRKVGIPIEKGTGFYTLRRTAATIAAETGDVFAVQGVLGHAGIDMASTYVQSTVPQTDKALKHTREWLQTTDPDDSE